MSLQFVIQSRNPATDNGMAPIGTRREIRQTLANYNTAPENGEEALLYGPGIEIEMPPEKDPVDQMLMSISEEEIAWLVVMRLAKELNWRILDPETGRELNP